MRLWLWLGQQRVSRSGVIKAKEPCARPAATDLPHAMGCPPSGTPLKQERGRCASRSHSVKPPATLLKHSYGKETSNENQKSVDSQPYRWSGEHSAFQHPYLNLVNCLLCAGFWAGSLLAVWLYKRQTGSLTLGMGVSVGALAGVWAGLFGLLLSLVGWAGAAALMKSYAPFLPSDANTELPPAGSASLLFNLAGVAVDTLFGAIGGLIGGAIFKAKPSSPSAVA